MVPVKPMYQIASTVQYFTTTNGMRLAGTIDPADETFSL